MEFISQKESYKGKFGDERLDKRAGKLASLLYFNQSCSIHGITRNEAEQKAAYRFLSNEKVEESKLISAITEKSSYLCDGKDLLILQDTTEVNLDDHRNRLQRGTGVGLTGNNEDMGFFIHGSLVLDATYGTLLGFSDIQLWHRPEDKATKDARKGLPIEQKESNKWIKACAESKERLQSSASITFVEDREGDIYDQFCLIPNEKTHLIIRSKSDRRLLGEDNLFAHLSSQPLAGSYAIEIVKDIRKGVESRTAQVEVRFCPVTLLKPKNNNRKDIAGHVTLYAVEVREVDANVKGSILWRILTSHHIDSYEQARAIVDKYRSRWHIEQLFRLLKKKGFNIESSEIENGWAIRKLTVMTLNAALRVMQLLLARDNINSQPIEQVFSNEEIECLQMLNSKLEGNTEKMKNRNDPQKLCWATWIIAKLGGWKGYERKRPPGPITLKKGLDKFSNIFEGWILARSAFQDVS